MSRSPCAAHAPHFVALFQLTCTLLSSQHTSCLLPLGAHLAGLGSVPDRRCSSVPRRFPRSRAHPGALRAEDPLRRHGGGRRGDRVGQTLSYVVPVVDTVVRLAGPQPAAAVDKRNHDPFSHGPKALILLPTGILCDQARHCRGQQDRRVCARSHRVRHSPSLARSNPRRLSA